MALLTFYDAAWPPAHPPATDGVCIYIGGDTLHVWSLDEIKQQIARYRLPVFVRSNPGAPGVSAPADVTAAVTHLMAMKAPAGTLVAWDMETAADAEYISTVYRLLRAAGYELIVYGSQSTVMGNQNPDGLYWGAQWTGSEHLASGDAMTQYVSFSAWDESAARSSLPFWDTHSGGGGHSPSPEPQWQVNMMNALPQLHEGDTGDLVRTVQGLCCARGHMTGIDGVFGTQTTHAVTAVQDSVKIHADGIVGPETWPVLLTGRT